MVLGVVVVLIIAAVVAATRRSHEHLGQDGCGGAGPKDLQRWAEAGLLTPAQVQAITEFETAHQPDSPTVGPGEPTPRRLAHGRRSRVPVVAEALGYLGGVLAAVGLVLVVAHSWDGLAIGVQIGLTAGASVAMFAVGAMAGRGSDPAFGRMQTFVWVASSAAAGACALVVAHGWLGSDAPGTLVMATAAVVCAQNALLWRGQRRPVQQAIALAAGAIAVGGATAMLAPAGWWGITVWACGLGMVALGLAHRGTAPEITQGIGALAMVVGAITVASEWQSGGNLFLVATALSLAGTALVPWSVAGLDRWILGGIGAVAVCISVPATVAWYAQGAGGTVGTIVWLSGAALLALGLASRVYLPLLAQGLGASTMLAGAAVTAAQWPSLAPAIGLATAIALLVVGTRPGAVLESLVGAVGLLIFVPWAVARWFPGESRAPILLVVSGLLILAIAVVIGRMGDRMRHELGSRSHPQ